MKYLTTLLLAFTCLIVRAVCLLVTLTASPATLDRLNNLTDCRHDR